ncbi:MAG TPA: GH25 family lysozyme [Kofleriaceae bacterium]|nr:GH25 family lysozyme [Kofleriaceae bacterium]
MRAPLIVVLLAMIPACMVGEGGQANDDAVAGDGLRDSDVTGTSGSGVGTIAARVCPNGPTVNGIDVSYYQGVIDWSAVKASGIEFAFVRLSDGAVFRDPKFDVNWQGAKSAGVIRGAYQFFRPGQNVDTQADMMINAIGTYQPGDLPPVIDVEAAGGLSPSTVATRVKQWVTKVKGALGVDPIVYTGKYFWRDQVGGERALASNALWIAQYTSLCPDIPTPWTRWTFWQHSDRGSVPGIREKVDLNKFNGTLADLASFAGGGGTPPPSFNQAPLPFNWQRNFDGSYTFFAHPPAGVTRLDIRVEDYVIGDADTTKGEPVIDYTFNASRDGRDVDVRGYDAQGAVIAVGNGLIDTTTSPKVFVDMTAASTYEFGLEDAPANAATVEVTADGYPLLDQVSGRYKSTRGMVEYAFTQPGVRELTVTTRDAGGTLLRQDKRTFQVR